MWFMTAWFLVWPAAWIFHAVLTGEDWWRVAFVPPIWLTVVWFNARITQLETLLLGTHTLTRRGFVRSKSVDWASIRNFRHWKKRGHKGAQIPMLTIEGDHGELSFPAHAVGDPNAVFHWALKQCADGNLSAIDERVRRDGTKASFRSSYLVHSVIALLLTAVCVAVIAPREIWLHAEHQLRAVETMSYPERVETLRGVFESSLYDQRTQCRARNKLMTGEISPLLDSGDDMFEVRLPRAIEYCEAMRAQGCTQRPFFRGDCSALTELQAAAQAWSRGDASDALQHLEESNVRGLVRYTIEIPALRATGQNEMAHAVAADCLDTFGESEAPVVRQLITVCQ